MLDPQAATYLAQLRSAGTPPVWDLPLDLVRGAYDAGAADLFGPADEIHGVEDADVGGVPVRVFRPTEGDLPAVVFFHGGGWVNGSIDSHDPLCRTLSARSGAVFISVEYRRAPEHVFPAAIEDCWKVTKWAADNFASLAVAGDSAGGQLAASVALRARDENVALELQALIYPATDYGFDTDSYREMDDPASLTEESMRWYWSQYVPQTPHGFERDYAPLRAGDLDGVAPALILTAEYDPLRDDGELYAKRFRAARVPVTLTRYDGMIHGFIRMASRIDASSRAIDEVAAAVAAAFV